MFLLDTTYCSKVIQGDSQVCDKVRQLGDSYVCTCAIVAGELYFMAHHSVRCDENNAAIRQFLAQMDVHPVDDGAAAAYGVLKEALFRRFGPKVNAKRQKVRLHQLGFSENDVWIAAVAKCRKLTVASADTDFDRIQEADGEVKTQRW